MARGEVLHRVAAFRNDGFEGGGPDDGFLHVPLQFPRHRYQLGRGSAHVPVQTLALPGLLCVTPRTTGSHVVVIPVPDIVHIQVGVVPVPSILLQDFTGDGRALLLAGRGQAAEQGVLACVGVQAGNPGGLSSESGAQLCSRPAVVVLVGGAGGDEAADGAHGVQGGGWSSGGRVGAGGVATAGPAAAGGVVLSRGDGRSLNQGHSSS